MLRFTSNDMPNIQINTQELLLIFSLTSNENHNCVSSHTQYKFLLVLLLGYFKYKLTIDPLIILQISLLVYFDGFPRVTLTSLYLIYLN